MNAKLRVLLVLAACAAMGLVVSVATADPLPGEKIKFEQLPMDGTKIGGIQYWGHDEVSTARIVPTGPTEPPMVEGEFMADDFADPFTDPVAHVKWWGSYLHHVATHGVQRFLVSFERDIPAGMPDETGEVREFSRPGKPILSQIVSLGPLRPGSGTFTEKMISLGGAPVNEALYEYNAELCCPFKQEPNTVYWLKIVALVGQEDPTVWGWHNRDYTIQDTYASVPPAVNPGEYKDGFLPPDPTGVQQPIWHFQDDAVTGHVKAFIHEPCQVEVYQDPLSFRPTHYVNLVDGPGPIAGTNWEGIGAHSKDLAFVLYTPVPEPSTLVLLGLALAGLTLWRRHGR